MPPDLLAPVLAALRPAMGASRTATPPRKGRVQRQTSLPPSPDRTLRASPTGGSAWVNAVANQARAAGVPPDLAIAIALEESGGDPRAVGDAGSSYGLFQLHKGGALGNLTPEQAYDPATNAGVVLRAWGRLGGVPTDPRAALMQYYSKVGRGSSNEIPTQRALAKLAEARQLLGGAAGATSAPGGGRTLAEGTVQNPVGGGLSPQALQSLMGYAMEITQRARGGLAPDPGDALRLVGPLMQAMAKPTMEVQRGEATPIDPGTSGREKIAIQAALGVLGTPYSWGGGTPAGPTRGIEQGAGITGFDCSSLIQYAWGKAGVKLPRTTYGQVNVGRSVPNLASAVPGDLLFPSEGHVMMYLGNGRAVESPRTGLSVRETDVTGRTFWRIRRPG